MFRFEDQGLTLRLFKDEHDAKSHSDVISVARYGFGVIGKNGFGRWVDAHGELPSGWVPNPKLLSEPKIHGYYVDVDSVICCADVAPRGCHFSFVEKNAHREVWIVKDNDGEVIDEYVLWTSLEEMATAGVDLNYKQSTAC